jgi:hypothetical protein
MADATEMNPTAGLDFAFDSVTTPGGSDDLWESNSVERFIVLAAGTHTITAQRATTNSSTNFRLDDYTLSVERAQRTVGTVAPAPLGPTHDRCALASCQRG